MPRKTKAATALYSPSTHEIAEGTPVQLTQIVHSGRSALENASALLKAGARTCRNLVILSGSFK